MKTLVQKDSTAYKSDKQKANHSSNSSIAKLVFMKKTQVLMVKKPEDEFWHIPEFRFRNIRNIKDRAVQFAISSLGVQIDSFDRSFGPFVCDSDDQDSLRVLGVVPLDWNFVDTPRSVLEIQMFSGLRVFENTDHLSRLVVNEYWINIEDIILHG